MPLIIPEGYKESERGREVASRDVSYWMGRNKWQMDNPPVNVPPSDIDYLKNLPNYDKLSPFENWAYRILPRVSEGFEWIDGKLESNWLGRQAKWAGSWMGKALSVLDVGAEFVERGAGTLVQGIIAAKEGDFEDFQAHLADAWYAGSMVADMTSLPRLKWKDITLEDGTTQKIVSGLEIPNELPGGYGVHWARKAITDLVEGGMDRKLALEQVRAGYYDSLGALSLRAQLYDTYFHIAGDISNVILPKLAPAELGHVLRIKALNKINPTVLDDYVRIFADAEKAGDVAKMGRAKIAIDTINEHGRLLTKTDQIILAFTGGDPLQPIESRLQKLNQRLNPFALTRESRAMEMLNIVDNNLKNYIFNTSDTEEKIIETIRRALDGSLGPEYGSAFMTLEGRLAQGALSAADVEAQKLIEVSRQTKVERTLMNEVSKMTGLTPAQIVEGANEGKALSIFTKLSEAIKASPDPATAAKVFEGITAKHIDDLKMLRGTPYTKELFKLYLSNAVSNKAAELAIVRFGVQSRGMITKMSYLMKSAETLAFIRLNPGFAIRNFINNEITMIARGVGGSFNAKDLERFVDDILGFEPHRLSQAAGIMGESITGGAKREYLHAGEKKIAEALRGERGMIDKGTEFFTNIKLPVDVGDWSRVIETYASRRAFYNGYIQGWNKYFWKPGKGYDRVRDYMGSVAGVGVADALPPDIVRGIENAVGNAKKVEDIEKYVRGNLNITSANIVDELERSLGKSLDDVFSPEMIQKIRTGIDDAVAGGEEGVNLFFRKLRREQMESLNDLFDSRIAQRMDEFRTNVQASGPKAFTHAWGEIEDEFWGAHNAYAMEMDYLAEGIGTLPRELANKRWAEVEEMQKAFWGRTWKRYEEAIKGLTAGANDVGIKTPDRLLSGFKTRRVETERFFKAKRKLFNDFFKKEDRSAVEWAAIQSQVDDMYSSLIETEHMLLGELNDNIARMLPDGPDQMIWRAWREKSRELVLADKRAVVAFRADVASLPPGEKEIAWRRFWHERQERWQEMSRVERAAAYATESGNPTGLAEEINRVQQSELLSARSLNQGVVDPQALPPRRTEPINPERVTVAYDANMRPYEFEERIVELDDLIASHNTNFQVNKNYPQELLQGRQRDRAAYQNQVLNQIIEPFNPEALLWQTTRIDDGSPIVFVDNLVESGNGRIIALKKMAAEYPEKFAAYQEALARASKRLGVDDLSGFDKPVLVRVRLSDVDRKAFANVANVPITAELSQYERAIGDASRLSDTVLQSLNIGEGSIYETLRRADNTDFLRTFAASLPPNELGSIMDAAGNISTSGLDRIVAALVARAFPGSAGRRILTAFIESADDDMGKIKTSVLNSIGRVNALESAIAAGRVPAEFSIADDLAAALDMYARLRRNGMTVDDFLRQGTFLDGALTPTQRELLKFIDLNKKGTRATKELLEEYAKAALKQSTAPTMFDTGIVTRQNIFDGVVGRIAPTSAAEIAAAGVVGEGVEEAPRVARQFIDNLDMTQYRSLTPPADIGEDQAWYNRGWEMIGRLEEQTKTAVAKPPLKWDSLNASQKALLEKYIAKVKGQLLDARAGAIKYGEFKRDSALLNYNRRFNYNSMLGLFAPFEFWATQSIMKWALHSVDRPAMLTNYLRIKELMETAGLPDENFPSRLKGSFRFELPFLPDWMGKGVWVDPLRVMLPFENFAAPWENEAWRQATVQGRAERLIAKWIGDNEISEDDGANALTIRSGDLWEQAVAQVQADDSRMRFDPMETIASFVSPHAPLMWAWEVQQGTPEDIGPFTPVSRMAKTVASLLGVDWDNSPLNIEGRFRKAIGLHPYDKWEDYRVDRMLSNMVALGEITVQDGLTAMIERGDNEAYREAVRKAGLEFAVGGLGSTFGIPAKAYPLGEESQRMLQDDFGRAYEAYRGGDAEALKMFFDLHPEYEARLAIWDEPEEKMRQFLVDNLWDKYHELPSVHKTELKEQLGPEFERYFLTKETRSYDSIPVDQLSVWLKLMGGDPPGTFTGTVPDVKFTDPEIAWRATEFYKMRNEFFPDWFELQDTYYKLNEEGPARKKFKNENPQLVEYWEWRRDFLKRNPDAAAFLTDTPPTYESPEEIRAAEEREPWYTPVELRIMLGENLYRFASRYVSGEDVPDIVIEQLEKYAKQQGTTVENLLTPLEFLSTLQ